VVVTSRSLGTHPSWNAYNRSASGYVLAHDCSCSDHSSLAHSNAGHEDSARTNRSVVVDSHTLAHPVIVGTLGAVWVTRSGVAVIDDVHSGANEHVVANGGRVIDVAPILYLAGRPYHYVRVDVYICPDGGVEPDGGGGANMCSVPHLNASG